MGETFGIGIDVGGTKILAGACDGASRLLVSKKIATESFSHSKEALNRRIITIIYEILAEVRQNYPGLSLAGIGVGSPGPLDIEEGLVFNPLNLGNWHNVPIVDIVRREFHCPAFLEHDGSIAAYGEYRAGAGRGCPYLAVITLGTGLGCGLILEGRIFSGKRGFAIEFGHTVISENPEPCVCGGRGCLEAFTCGAALLRFTRRALEGGRTSLVMAESPEALTPGMIIEAANRGDELCREVLEHAGDYLGRGLVTLINLIGPGKVLIGGGLSLQGDIMIETARRVVQERAWPAYRDTPVEKTALGAESGLYGACLLPLDRASAAGGPDRGYEGKDGSG
jgi:glucokinase